MTLCKNVVYSYGVIVSIARRARALRLLPRLRAGKAPERSLEAPLALRGVRQAGGRAGKLEVLNRSERFNHKTQLQHFYM